MKMSPEQYDLVYGNIVTGCLTALCANPFSIFRSNHSLVQQACKLADLTMFLLEVTKDESTNNS